MVNISLNKPIGKVAAYPIFWMRVVGTKWFCRSCHMQKESGAVCFEITTRSARKNHTGTSEALKLFLCLDCGEKLIDDALTQLQMCKNMGPDAYRLFSNV